MRTRTSFLVVLVLGLGWAASANAAVSVGLSGSCVGDGNVCSPGGEVILTTTVTADAGETDDVVFGAINFSDAQVNSNVAGNSQVDLSTIGTAAPGWIQDALICTTVFCVAFSQKNTIGPQTAGLTNVAIATTTFFIDGTTPFGSVIQFTWRSTPSTQRLDWFGITNAPGISLTVGGPFIPEPATAALLAAGLLGLGAWRRRLA